MASLRYSFFFGVFIGLMMGSISAWYWRPEVILNRNYHGMYMRLDCNLDKSHCVIKEIVIPAGK